MTILCRIIVILLTAFLKVHSCRAEPNSEHLKNLHHYMTKGQLQETFNVDHPDDVPEYDVTHPYQSTSDGQFLSHDLRRRRSSDEHHYSIKSFGKTLHLNLKENKDLVAPGLMLESYIDGQVRRSTLVPSTHYFGRVKHHPGSSVALSNHGTLSGKIDLSDETLYIRPFPRGLLEGSDRTPHFIFKQTKDNVEEGVAFDDKTSDYDKSFYHISDQADNGFNMKLADKNNQNTKNYLELALVTDEKVAKKYGKGTSDFLLTVANIAAQAFQHPSIGDNKITLVVTRLVILSTKELNATSYSTKDQLRAIEKWMNRNNPHSDNDPGHYDAVSLMRSVSGGGLASLGTMCRRVSANTISENGITSWAVLAHELAHNLGIGHDGSKNCSNGVNIMSTVVPGGPGSFEWSQCSATRFNLLFNQSRFSCLKDAPQASPIPTRLPELQGKKPGVIYNKTVQCQMRYGPGFVACAGGDPCSKLWCARKESPLVCSTSLAAPADGTRCGIRNWCIQAKCVDDGSPVIHGGWSSWSDVTQCSRSCDRGIKYRTRTCTKPPPQNGGNKCAGLAKGHIEVCNIQECSPAQTSFRSQQCEAKKGKEYKSFHNHRSCDLRCRKGPWVHADGQVKDGSNCDPDKTVFDVCIEGQCLMVGCDLKVGSNARRDRCGICNGDGKSCEFVNGSFTLPHRPKGVANAALVVVLPVGAVNISVIERSTSWNNVLLTHMDGSLVYGVTHWNITKYVAGTKVFVGRGTGNYKDRFYIPGPLTKQLRVIYSKVYGRNPGIDYEFYRPIVKPSLPPSQEPPVTTEGPSQGPPVTTEVPSQGPPVTTERPSQGPPVTTEVPSQGPPVTTEVPSQGPPVTTEVPSQRPSVTTEGTTQGPPVTTEEHTQGPPVTTEVPSQGPPVTTEGPSQAPPVTTERTSHAPPVTTKEHTQGPLVTTEVPSQGPPVTTEKPSQEPPTQPPSEGPTQSRFQWKTGQWSECSQTCAIGIQSRSVQCVRADTQASVSASLCTSTRPVSLIDCNTQPCPPEWHITDWLPCSVSCGNGVQSRLVYCDQQINSTYHHPLPFTKCDMNTKPRDLKRDCDVALCPPDWMPTPWGECSTSCDEGIKTRTLKCTQTKKDGMKIVVSDELCKNATRYPTEIPCNQDNPCHIEPPLEIPIACFRDRDHVLWDAEILGDFKDAIDWDHTYDIIDECRHLAYDHDYTHFALGNNGICYSGIDFNTYYYHGAGARKNKCKNGVGKRNHYYVYRLDPLPEYHSIGCFQRGAFPSTYSVSFRGQIDWHDIHFTVEQCAHIVYDMGKIYFGLHYYGECYSGRDDQVEEKLMTLPGSRHCYNHAVGKAFADYVYAFDTLDDETIMDR